MSMRSISLRALPAIILSIMALVLAAGSAPLSATSYVMVSDEALVDAAPVAAVVRVVSEDRAAGQRQPKTMPAMTAMTEYVVQVEESLKGEIPGGTAIVRMPGGQGLDGMNLKIYGMPRLRSGERALLFLEPAGDGTWRIMHLILGAFREIEAGGHRLAVRDLDEAREVRKTSAGIEAVPGSDRLRDFDGFARWVADRAHADANTVRRSADYYVQDNEGSVGKAIGEFRLFEDADDGHGLRWFQFDTAGNVKWLAYKNGQQGVPGGGYADLQAALNAWNGESQTPVDYRYGGKTKDKSGLLEYDTINSVVFNDPNGELPSFSCSSGGVLAYGGPWYFQETTPFQGKQYHQIANADVVINDGLACFFRDSPSAPKAAAELFGHELGHTLGLNHACGDNGSPGCDDNAGFDEALMRAFIHDDGRGATLSPDDQAGLRALYELNPAPVAPTNLQAFPVSTTAIGLTWQDNATDETEYRIEMRTLGGDFHEVGSAPANATSTEIGGLTPATGYVFRIKAINGAGSSAYSNEAAAATNGPVGACVANATTLCLNNDRFRVQVAWKTASEEGVASTVPVVSDDSGLFYFFTPDNWEMLIKVLDGCASTSHYWVFYAATTNVQFVVTVTDTQTGKVKTYFNPQGFSANAVTDTNAFATCP
ncbi:MAG: hypothetical protein QOH06_4290 [Acidobacteriota bacterium]|jgi:hypothetical protein|nr:hypothetical protein [Acidobacteriota bacterium]